MSKLVLDGQLRKLLKQYEKNLSLLAKEVDIAPSTLHGWINGLEPKSIIQLKKVADYFGESLEYLCFNEDLVNEQSKIQIFQSSFMIQGKRYEISLSEIEDELPFSRRK